MKIKVLLLFVFSVFGLATLMLGQQPNVDRPIVILLFFTFLAVAVYSGVVAVLKYLGVGNRTSIIIGTTMTSGVVAITMLSSFASLGIFELAALFTVLIIFGWYIHRSF